VLKDPFDFGEYQLDWHELRRVGGVEDHIKFLITACIKALIAFVDSKIVDKQG